MPIAWSWSELPQELLEWLPLLATVADLLLIAGFVPWVLMTKSEPTSAWAWCLIIVGLPFFGALLFLIFGWQHVGRPLRRKKRHKARFQSVRDPEAGALPASAGATAPPPREESMPRRLEHLAEQYGAGPASQGNRVTLYHAGQPVYDAMLAAIQQAEHHIHLQTFIFQPDDTGAVFLQALIARAKAKVQVRLLYDAFGSRRVCKHLLRELRQAGGKISSFLPFSLLSRRIRINMRNHRKLLIVDGRVAFLGGNNIGDEYAGKSERFGYWRDAHLRVEGPAVRNVQLVFAEDWDFAYHERLRDSDSAPVGRSYYRTPSQVGPHGLQILASGPDQTYNAMREQYFAAILAARQRLWIASPYFVPDAGLRDALRLAGQLGVDVRLLCQFQPDHLLPQLAARYYWSELLEAGVKVYQYTKGMMHSKFMIVDGQWATLGSANLDNRSLHLNFEVNALFSAPDLIAELEEAYRNDLREAIRLDPRVYRERPFTGRLLENAARLFSPIL